MVQIVPAPPNPGLKELVTCKNRLQEFLQKAKMLLSLYHTVSDGQSHQPEFRATVLVDGVTYSSPNTFLTRKAAEHDVVRVALGSLSQNVEIEVTLLIQKDILFCKSILREYAAKMHLTLPTYKAFQAKGILPVFFASFSNGQNFVGETAKSKKEAEQLAARAAIESVLADPNTKTAMCQIINSKGQPYSVFGNMDNPSENSMSDGMKKIRPSVGSDSFSGAICGSCRKQLDELEDGGSVSKKARKLH